MLGILSAPAELNSIGDQKGIGPEDGRKGVQAPYFSMSV
jgi:hypothetical protein